MPDPSKEFSLGSLFKASLKCELAAIQFVSLLISRKRREDERNCWLACGKVRVLCGLSLYALSQDYVNIMEFLIKHWNIAGRQGLSAEAQHAQEDVMNLLTRFKKLTDRQASLAKKKKPIPSPFSWVFNNEVSVLP